MSCTAESLTSYIKEVLEKYQIDPRKMVCQCYDGAAVMSGSCSGVRCRVQEFAPHAVYSHCYAHCLNLALVDCAKTVPVAWEFFTLLQSLYTFMSSTKAHSVFIRLQKELHPDKPQHQLQQLSDTRWAYRQGAVHAICCTFDAVVATLEEIEEDSDRAKAMEARGYLLQIKCFKFVLSLIIFDRVLSCSRCLSDALQSSRLDLAKAADLVTATIETLEEFRSDEQWKKVFDYAVRVAEHHAIEVVVPQRRQSRQPRRLEDTVFLASSGRRDAPGTNCSEHLKVALYFAVLDAFLSELKRRFDSKNLQIMKAVQACSPGSSNFLRAEDLCVLAEAYDIDADAVTLEARLAQASLKGKDMDNLGHVLHELAPLKAAFPCLTTVIHIALTFAVSSATCERSFSALTRIKTWRRSTMSEPRLNDLAVLSMERDLSRTLDLGAVVQEFAALDKNRRIALY